MIRACFQRVSGSSQFSDSWYNLAELSRACPWTWMYFIHKAYLLLQRIKLILVPHCFFVWVCPQPFASSKSDEGLSVLPFPFSLATNECPGLMCPLCFSRPLGPPHPSQFMSFSLQWGGSVESISGKRGREEEMRDSRSWLPSLLPAGLGCYF